MYKLGLFVGLFLATAFSANAVEYSWENEKGDVVALSSLEGQPVMLHFWASWCGPCRSEMPALARWVGEHPEVKVVMLSLDNGREAAERFFAAHDINVPLNMGSMRDLSAVGVRGLPSTLLVDASGKITKRYLGDINWLNPQKSDEILSSM
ncbi:MAG: TlpA disulfide reductase family protein [Ghiorsea sp.]